MRKISCTCTLYSTLWPKKGKKHKVMLFMGAKKEKNIKLRLDGHAK
jgi:hypothetical protein